MFYFDRIQEPILPLQCDSSRVSWFVVKASTFTKKGNNNLLESFQIQSIELKHCLFSCDYNIITMILVKIIPNVSHSLCLCNFDFESL